jgi:hypothetical protein
MAFVRCKKKIITKTIIRSNYSPNGASFVDGVDWNKDTDTMFVSLTNNDATLKQSVFSLSDTAENVGKWDSSDYINLHTVFPYTAIDNLEFDILAGWHIRKRLNLGSNELKLAINKDNIYVNGTAILKDGTWYVDTPTVVADAQVARWNSCMSLNKLYIGSAEGTTRAYCIYHEISVHHKLYNSSELKQLTTV